MLRGNLRRGPIRKDLPPELVEPVLRAAVARTPAFHELPERGAVMVLDEMADLMDDDVVEHVVRSEHETPVEAQRTGARARAPAGPLVAQRDALELDFERLRLRLRDQRDARAGFAPPLRSGETESIEPEAGLRGLLELLRQPLEIRRDRRLDLGSRRARTDDELGREPVPHDHTVSPHALRPAYVQLDRTPRHVHDVHGCTVGVVSDDNACAGSHGRVVRPDPTVFLVIAGAAQTAQAGREGRLLVP